MTAEEMIRKLRIAMRDEVEPFHVSSETLFTWLSDAYLRIQLESEQWKFFHTRGLLITTADGTAEYSLGGIKEIDADSLYCVRDGETVRYPMYMYLYDAWVLDESINLQQGGNPRYLIKLPNGNWRVEPDPTEIWRIYGNAWYSPAGFESLDDEPIWDAEYHSLVVWEALKIASVEWPEERQVQRMQANLAANLPIVRRAFNYKYLEDKRGARAML